TEPLLEYLLARHGIEERVARKLPMGEVALILWRDYQESQRQKGGSASSCGLRRHKSALAQRSKRGTEHGGAGLKIDAALPEPHRYADGGCMNLEPIGNNALARQAHVSESTASAFFKGKFKGYTKYKALCRDSGRLVAVLKLLNDEFAP